MKADWRIFTFPDLLHLLFPFLLLLPEFPLAGDVPTIALSGDVLGKGADGLAGDDLHTKSPQPTA